MRRWHWTTILVLCASAFVVLEFNRSAYLLQDSDTAFLLKVIRQPHSVLRWFAGDWPLGNHFYRPIPTLLFELDNALYGSAAWGYGLTNALLCGFSMLALFWFAFELLGSRAMAASSAVIFGFWNLGWHCSNALVWLPLLGLIALLPMRQWWRGMVVAALAGCAVYELDCFQPFSVRVLEWLPGRTASSMTVFVFLSLASYLKYERLSAMRDEVPAKSTDVPATKSSRQTAGKGEASWRWFALSLVFQGISYMCYEQAIMLPGLLLGIGVALRWQRFQVRWKLHTAFWFLLVAYIGIRYQVLPHTASGYQNQQFRHGQGVFMSIAEFVAPNFPSAYLSLGAMEPSLSSLMIPSLILPVLGLLANLVGLTAILRDSEGSRLTLVTLILSLLAFLPMAWLKIFEHYYFLPMGFRAVFVVCLFTLFWKWFVSAGSPRAIQAPLRQRPAPGSLPRP